MAAVVAACTLSYAVDQLGYYYSARLLQRHQSQKFSAFGEFMYRFTACYVSSSNWIGLGRKSSMDLLKMEKKLKRSTEELWDPNHPRSEIVLKPEEEAVLVEAIVDAENLNIWALLMPAVYQLVPGSLIAKLWYNSVLPPPLLVNEREIEVNGETYKYQDVSTNTEADNTFYGLFVISTSLALGLLLGFTLVQILTTFSRTFFSLFACFQRHGQTESEEKLENERKERLQFRQQGVTMGETAEDDPLEGDPVLTRDGSRPDAKQIGGERIERIRALMTDAIDEGDEQDPEDNSMLKMDERQLSKSD